MPNRMNERVTGIIFKNIELPESDVKNEGVVSLPGLGLDDEVITALNNGDKEEPNRPLSPSNMNVPPTSDLSVPPPPIQFNHHQNMLIHQIHMQQLNQQMTTIKKENAIPGLDTDEIERRKV